MPAPSMTTSNTAGNLLSSQSLAASGTITFNVDVSSKFEAQVQIGDTGGGTVAATNGVQVDAYRRIGSGPVDDTVAVFSFVITTVVSTASYASLALPTGRWKIKLTNLDASNAVTVVATDDTIDTVA